MLTTVWKQRFRRMNFEFVPPLEQIADVIFVTSVPLQDEYIEEFDAASWEAMWEQNPHWKDRVGSVRGWSDVMTDGEIVEAINAGTAGRRIQPEPFKKNVGEK